MLRMASLRTRRALQRAADEFFGRLHGPVDRLEQAA